MFPGQGAQTVGMGKELYEEFEVIQQLYETANDVLNVNIQELMFHGPEETLTETEHAQPALLLSSVAAYTLLAQENIFPSMTVGHSLGEYSALVASEVLTFEEAIQLVQTRGRLMEEAYPKGQGTMAAVLGMKEEAIKTTLEQVDENEVVDIANLNSPGQIVISGSQKGIEEAAELLKEAGAKRVLPLNVSGPFHSRLMQPANNTFQASLNEATFHEATVPVYANVTAEPVTDKEQTKELLIKQLYSPVRFEESVRNMIAEGVDAFVEVGTGKVLSGLLKKIDRKMTCFQVQDKASLEKFIAWYKEEE